MAREQLHDSVHRHSGGRWVLERRDLLRFRHALVGDKLLDARNTAWVVTNQLPAETPPQSGFGIGVAGGAPGVNTELEIGDEFTIIVLANLDPSSASEVARHLRDLVEALE